MYIQNKLKKITPLQLRVSFLDIQAESKTSRVKHETKTTGDGDVVKLLRAFRLVRTARLCFGVEFFQRENHGGGRRGFGQIILISPDGFWDLSCIERF